jgi:glutamyl-tRNA synthetase
MGAEWCIPGPSFAAMADYTLNVSLKANPIPYGLIAQAIFANIEASFLDTAEHDITLNHGGELVTDQVQIAHFLAEKAAILEGSSKVSGLDGPSMCRELISTQAPDFLNVATQLRGTLAFPDLVASLDQLDNHLAFRTFLVGHELSSVDLAVWGACKGEPGPYSAYNWPLTIIQGSGQVLGILKKGQHPHLSRFYSYVEKLPISQQALNAVNAARQKKVGLSELNGIYSD